MQIAQKWTVGNEIFDSKEEAEAYLEVHQDQARVDAYIDFLRKNGTKKVSGIIPQHLLDFIRFEKGTLVVDPTASETVEEEPEIPEVKEEEIEQEAASEPAAEVKEEAKTDPKPSLFAQNDTEAKEADDGDNTESLPEVAPEVMASSDKPKGKSLFAT
ncbi:MAG: hypothetical protein ACRBB6_04150 [Neptuniibacter sp.]